MYRPAFVTIDLQAYEHNLNILRTFAPQSRLVVVVKANAYGHNIQNFVKSLHYADMVAVSCLEEAIELRTLGYMEPILLLEGFFHISEIEILEKQRFIPVIRDEHQLQMLKAYRFEKSISVWLKINTGMNRLGIPPEKLDYFWREIKKIKAIQGDPVLMTHFACADDENNPATLMQINHFQRLMAPYATQTSLCNSAGLLAWSDAHQDWVRPGLVTYGISPFKNKSGADFGLKPVMQLHSQIISIQLCRAGEQIGYGATYTCSEDMKIGVVAMGYADGYPQQARNGTPVMVNGRQTKLVGRVSMDMLTIDLTPLPDVKIGDPVTLWGPGLPVEVVAEYANTSAYELVCGISRRVKQNCLSA